MLRHRNHLPRHGDPFPWLRDPLPWFWYPMPRHWDPLYQHRDPLPRHRDHFPGFEIVCRDCEIPSTEIPVPEILCHDSEIPSNGSESATAHSSFVVAKWIGKKRKWNANNFMQIAITFSVLLLPFFEICIFARPRKDGQPKLGGRKTKSWVEN